MNHASIPNWKMEISFAYLCALIASSERSHFLIINADVFPRLCVFLQMRTLFAEHRFKDPICVWHYIRYACFLALAYIHYLYTNNFDFFYQHRILAFDITVCFWSFNDLNMIFHRVSGEPINFLLWIFTTLLLLRASELNIAACCCCFNFVHVENKWSSLCLSV